MKTAVLTDSTFYMSQEDITKYDVFQVPLFVSFDSIMYTENHKDKSAMKDIFSKIKKDKDLPKSSQPSSQGVLTKLKEIEALGYERILFFTLSSGISGTYQGALVATSMFNEESNVEVNVFDTQLVALCAVPIVVQICERIKNGEELPTQKIQDIINFSIRNNVNLFVVDDLNYLAYGGRISPSIAAFGNIVGIKPILHISDGKIVQYDKVRSTKKAYKKMMLSMVEFAEKVEGEFYFSTTHCFNPSDAKKISSATLDNFPDGVIQLSIEEMGPVISTHVGQGTLGMCVMAKYPY